MCLNDFFVCHAMKRPKSNHVYKKTIFINMRKKHPITACAKILNALHKKLFVRRVRILPLKPHLPLCIFAKLFIHFSTCTTHQFTITPPYPPATTTCIQQNNDYGNSASARRRIQRETVLWQSATWLQFRLHSNADAFLPFRSVSNVR